jgi:hypothetical protein
MELLQLFKNISHFKTIILFPQTNSSGIVSGKVLTRNDRHVFYFEEYGSWKIGKKTSTINNTQWIIQKNHIDLYRNRYSNREKLSTFVLPSKNNKSIFGDKYLCSRDLYSPQIKFFSSSMLLKWDIAGPKKQGIVITYYY